VTRRLRELEPLRSLPRELEPDVYNTVRLGLLRLGEPLRLELPEFRVIDCIAEETVWLCVDASAEDQPLLGWTDFRRREHGRLDVPVSCRLHFYHYCAGLIMGTALPAVAQAVRQRLGAQGLSSSTD